MSNQKGILFVLMFLLAGGVFAQESRFSFGTGGEISGGYDNPDKDASDPTVLSEVYKSGGGGGWTGVFEYRINNRVSAGLKSGVRHDFEYWVMVFEQSIFARIYILNLKGFEIFAEPGLGGAFVVRENQNRAFLDAYVIAGVRIPLGNWYVEPYIGSGYPFWGRVGVVFGYRVPPRPATVVAAAAPGSQGRSPDADPAKSVAEGRDAANDAESRMNEAFAQLPPSQNTGYPSASFVPDEPARDIFFPPNGSNFSGLSAETAGANQRILDDVAKTLMAHPEYRALLEGYANPTENTVAERSELVELSRQRADMVADMLINVGVSRKQLVIAGAGGYDPSTNPDINRRVTITMLH